jgi:hypothetical protein
MTIPGARRLVRWVLRDAENDSSREGDAENGLLLEDWLDEAGPHLVDVEEVIQDTTRVLTHEEAASEWQRMTKAAGPGVQLPPDLED